MDITRQFVSLEGEGRAFVLLVVSGQFFPLVSFFVFFGPEILGSSAFQSERENTISFVVRLDKLQSWWKLNGT